MRRFYIPKERWRGGKARLDADQLRHLTRVLRMGRGDAVIVFDGDAEFLAEVGPVDKSGAWCGIIRPLRKKPEKTARIILAPALIRARRMDMVVEKAVELGADEIAPFSCERCVVKPKADKTAHWRKIAESAAAQSGRIEAPEIRPPVNFTSVLRIKADHKIMLWEGERKRNLGPLNIAAGAKGGLPTPSILLLAGPEGGFTAGEMQSAVDAGFRTWGISTATLRAETASIAGLAILTDRAL